MGEMQEWLFEPSFNRAVKVCASDERITSDAGFVLLREADHRLGLTESLAQRLVDPRRQDLIRYQLVELLRARLYALAQGYSAQDDADRLAHDPAMKLAAWNRPGQQPLEQRLASQPTQSRLIDMLTLTPGNRAALCDCAGRRLPTSSPRHRRRPRRTQGDHRHRQLSDCRAWPATRRRLQRPLPGDRLSSAGRQLLGGRQVRQHASRASPGQRLRACHLAARPGPHGPGREAFRARGRAQGWGPRTRPRFPHRRRLYGRLDVGLPDRRKTAFSRATQEQSGARSTGLRRISGDPSGGHRRRATRRSSNWAGIRLHRGSIRSGCCW